MTINVPGDAATIQSAVDLARPGDTVLVGPGSYPESVAVRTADLTVRGTDRNAVVLDGGGLRPNGIVVTAPGVTVANLTVHDYTLNGVLVTGLRDQIGGIARGSDGYHRLDPAQFPPLQGFAVRYVTASNNGLYGVYAFDAQHGVIERSYASGHADSGFYVGQCRECDIVVRANTGEYNAVGYEQANASDSVSVVGNRFSDNRVGLTLLSDYQEAFVPQRSALVAGNLVSNNDASQTPAQADGGFGIGIGISGGQQNSIVQNRVVGHRAAGFVLSSAEDLAPQGNRLLDNVTADNTLDLAYLASARAPGSRNCYRGTVGRTLPAGIKSTWACPGSARPTDGGSLKPQPAPEGISFREVRAPRPQPQLPLADLQQGARAPSLTVEEQRLPSAGLLASTAHGS